MPVNIHGKQYITVAERVSDAHKDAKFEKLETEVLSSEPVIVIKATVTILGRTFTGISSANPAKSIEKSNPYEVAETSAVGRALGFAGYGIVEGIASADEMVKAGVTKDDPDWIGEPTGEKVESNLVCQQCGKPTEYKEGKKKDGGVWKGYFCTDYKCKHVKWIH